MSNNKLFRFGGIAAILSAVLYLTMLGLGFAGIIGGLGTALYIISSILFLVVIVALYMDLRGEAALTALAAFILLGVMTVWSLFLDAENITPIWGPLTLAYGFGTILFGWLQRRNSRYPNRMGVVAIVTGTIALIGGIALMAGASADIFGLLNLILTVPYFIWLVWLGIHYLKA